MVRFVFIFLFLASHHFLSALSTDSTKTKKSVYFGWGYNRNWYTTSDIHIANQNPQLINGKYYTYDYTVYDAKAFDRPQFDRIKDVINITIPQFSARLGFFLNDKYDVGFEINYDHAKYVVADYQKVHIVGEINGEYVNKDTILDPDKLLHFEHSDGANFWMFNFIKRWKLTSSKNQKLKLGFIFKSGFGVVFPRTDVTVFGQRVNNRWKLSGVIGGVETGIRAEFFKNIYLEYTGKAAYANYLNVIVQGKGYGKANHKFGVAENILILGYQF
jgi:hypothetical protein